jgi:hypothetical protein
VLLAKLGLHESILCCRHDHHDAVVGRNPPPHAPAMFVVTEADAAAIRAVYQQRGEFAAAVELRRLFPGITDNAQAMECVNQRRPVGGARASRRLRKR